MDHKVYEIYIDADPQTITMIGINLFLRWVDFAMGEGTLGGKKLMHPTGRYASAISFKQIGVAKVAIVADEEMAPEAAVLETGHGPIDLKKSLKPGKAYPMHRGKKGAYGSAGYGSPIFSKSAGARTKNIWAQPRAQGSSGYARVPSKITPQNVNSWVIPAMPMYSPAAHLVDLLRNNNKKA